VVGGGVVNYLLSLIIMVPMLVFSGIHPSWVWLYFPIILISETLLSIGLSLFFSALNVLFRDVEHILNIVFMLLFYLTPVVYSSNMIPKRLFEIYKLNPIADIIISFQSIFYYRESPHWKLFLYSIAFSVITIVVGNIVFQYLNRRFAEEV
jgi:ABC-2 type transport system permease protein